MTLANLAASLLMIGALRLPVSQTQSLPKDLMGFAKWKPVNAKRHFVPGPEAFACRGPSQEELQRSGPHLGKYISVKVNDTGQAAMMSKNPRFPVGSVIVKEKHYTATSDQLELATVMIKREKGYNPKAGDWEYAVIDGNSKLTDRGKLTSCINCHAKQAKTDFVFRTYLHQKPAQAERSPLRRASP